MASVHFRCQGVAVIQTRSGHFENTSTASFSVWALRTHSCQEDPNCMEENTWSSPAVIVENQRWGNCISALDPTQVTVGPRAFFKNEIWDVGMPALNNWRYRNCVPFFPLALQPPVILHWMRTVPDKFKSYKLTVTESFNKAQNWPTVGCWQRVVPAVIPHKAEPLNDELAVWNCIDLSS